MPAWSERAGAAGDDGARRGETQSEEIAAIAASRESRLGARDMSRVTCHAPGTVPRTRVSVAVLRRRPSRGGAGLVKRASALAFEGRASTKHNAQE